ncbi:GH15418 [Drosophila grimshawi]|uniref:GH15418 n=1 Tax=Drosophila grimshawi TaxID=7222 RepID=B4J2R4_DROGR|nr:GH15418 [Drosophila grimshawi]
MGMGCDRDWDRELRIETAAAATTAAAAAAGNQFQLPHHFYGPAKPQQAHMATE